MDCVAQDLAKHDFLITVKSVHLLTKTDTESLKMVKLGLESKYSKKIEKTAH